MKRTILTGLALLLILTILPSPTASAKVRRQYFPEHDVTTVFGDGSTTIRRTPNDIWYADLSKATVTHSRKRIKIRLDFHTLQIQPYDGPVGHPDTKPATFAEVFVRGRGPKQDDKKYNRRVRVQLRTKKSSGAAYFKPSGVYNLKKVCNVKKKVRYDDWNIKDGIIPGYIVVSAPRRCFGFPRAVQIQSRVFGRWDAPHPDDDRWFVIYDDPRPWSAWAPRG